MSGICHQAIDTYRGAINNSPMSSSSINVKNSDMIETGTVNIAKLVTNLRTAIEPYPKNVPIYYEVAEDVPPIIHSDNDRLLRSALNYLTNACKVTKRGSITLRIFTQRRNKSLADENKKHLVFEVEDSGGGIDVQKYPGLFSAFRTNSEHDGHSQSSWISNASKSIGLGLSSVATNILALNGQYGFDVKAVKFNNRMRRCASTGSFFSISKRQKTQEKCRTIFWFSIPINTSDIGKICDETPEMINRKKLKKQNLIESLNVLKKAVNKTEKPVVSKVLPHYDQTGDFKIDMTLKRSSANSLFDMKEIRTSDAPQNTKFKPFTNTTSMKTFHLGVSHNSGSLNNDKSRPKEALIIDDSLTIRKTIDRALSNLGFQVSQAENGMTGLQCMKRKTFDIVFCDFLMPVMDGLDCVKQFRRWEKDHRTRFRQVSFQKTITLCKYFMLASYTDQTVFFQCSI